MYVVTFKLDDKIIFTDTEAVYENNCFRHGSTLYPRSDIHVYEVDTVPDPMPTYYYRNAFQSEPKKEIVTAKPLDLQGLVNVLVSKGIITQEDIDNM